MPSSAACDEDSFSAQWSTGQRLYRVSTLLPEGYVKLGVCMETSRDTADDVADIAGPSLNNAYIWNAEQQAFESMYETNYDEYGLPINRTLPVHGVAVFSMDDPVSTPLAESDYPLVGRTPATGEYTLPLYPGDNLVTTPVDTGCALASDVLDAVDATSIAWWDAATQTTYWYPQIPTGSRASESVAEVTSDENFSIGGCTPLHLYFDTIAQGTNPTWPPTCDNTPDPSGT